jgi:GNAT superfamily N-acetyltransferase
MVEHDWNALSQLYIEFHEFHVQGVSNRLQIPKEYDLAELQTYLLRIMHSTDSAIFVVEVDERIVGFAEIYLRHAEPKPVVVARHYGHLQSLMVTQAFRKHGLGAQLIAAAERWAQAAGATEVQLDTWEFADGPLHFYEAIGYKTLKRKLVKMF